MACVKFAYTTTHKAIDNKQKKGDKIYEKRKKIILIIILLFLSLGIVVGMVDYNWVKQNKAPLFAICVNTYYDGDSKEYYGTGHKVIQYNVLDNLQPGQECRKKTIFGFCTLKYKNEDKHE